MEKEQDKFIRFHWLNAPKEEFFFFFIDKSEITNQTILIIKDFAEKKELRKEVRASEKELKTMDGGVYISVGAIIIILLILILVL